MRGRDRKVVAISRSVAGTVRAFESGVEARRYVRNCRLIAKVINSMARSRNENLEVLPIQILDIKDNKILERVYPRPSCLVVYSMSPGLPWPGRYAKSFFDSMKRKGISQEEVKEAVTVAHGKLKDIKWDMLRANKSDFDSADSNILVLNYDPKTKKVLFGLVDIFHSR